MLAGIFLFLLGWAAWVCQWMGWYEPYATYILWGTIGLAVYDAITWIAPRFTTGNIIYKTIIILVGIYLLISAVAVGPMQLLVLGLTPLYIWLGINIIMVITGRWAIQQLLGRLL